MSHLPFVGLRPFKSEEADIFFGRETHLAEFLTQFNTLSFMTLVGSAGSGKTSFINAGIVPHLLNDKRDAAVKWKIAEMQPGETPFANLAKALQAEQALNTNFNAIQIDENLLRSSSTALNELLDKHPLPRYTKLLIIVDQFEALFRYPNDETAAFIDLLTTSTTSYSATEIHVLISLRAGYLKQCRAFPNLAIDMSHGLFLLPNLTREQVKCAIEMPIALFGGDIEQELSTQLLEDIAQNELPLLQLALLTLWKKSVDQQLTIFDYYVVGGIKRVLSNHADQLFFNLTAEQQVLAKKLFKALLVADEQGGIGTQPLKLVDIAALAKVDWKALIKVADAFRQESEGLLLPILPQILTAETYLDIAHEGYCQQWHQLAEWVSEETNAAHYYTQLKNAAMQYQSANGALLCASELDQIRHWFDETQPTELWSKRYGGEFALAKAFLEKCKRIALLKKASIVTVGVLMLAVTSIFTFSFMRAEVSLQSKQQPPIAQKSVKTVSAAPYQALDHPQSTVVLYEARQHVAIAPY